MNTLIVNKLIHASPNDLIQPFQVDEWWLIIKLLDKKQAKLDKETSKMLLIELFDNFVKNMTQNFLENHFRFN